MEQSAASLIGGRMKGRDSPLTSLVGLLLASRTGPSQVLLGLVRLRTVKTFAEVVELFAGHNRFQNIHIKVGIDHGDFLRRTSRPIAFKLSHDSR